MIELKQGLMCSSGIWEGRTPGEGSKSQCQSQLGPPAQNESVELRLAWTSDKMELSLAWTSG